MVSFTGAVDAADAVDDRAEQTRARRPAAAKMPAMRCAVVVLPLVPVTPATVSSREGSPYKRAAMSAMARRTEAPRPASTASSSAPLADQRRRRRRRRPAAAKSWPSALSPGTQKKSVPARRHACDRRAPRSRGRVAATAAPASRRRALQAPCGRDSTKGRSASTCRRVAGTHRSRR